MGIAKDLTGQRFGRLIAVKTTGEKRDRNFMWLCKCDCGGERTSRANSLLSGLTRSCGCLSKKSKIGSKNPMWKGDDIGLTALHSWVRYRKSKPELCEKCNKRKPQDLANISQEYKRDIDDFEWLCRRCHMGSDGRMNRRNGRGQFERII